MSDIIRKTLGQAGLLLVTGSLLLCTGTAGADLVFKPAPTIKSRIKVVSVKAVRMIGNGYLTQYIVEDPLPGASFHLKVTFQASSSMPTPFNINVTLPGNNVTTQIVSSLSSSAYIPMAGIPIHEPFTYQVYVDTENKAGETAWQRMDNWKWSTLSFSYPAQAMQKFDTVTYDGFQQLNVSFSGSGTVNLVAAMIGVPDTSARQVIVTRSGRLEVHQGGLPLVYYFYPVSSAPHAIPIYFMDATPAVPDATHLTFRSDFRVQVSNLRVNPLLLGAVTWEQVDTVAQKIDYFKTWVASEGVLFDVQAKEVGDFVTKALGADPRSSHTPYQAARALFIAVTNHISYLASSGNDTLVDIIKNREADCGGYAALWVTALRRIGIPARAVTTNRSGYRAHVWGEFYLPGIGWVPGDPQDDPDSSTHSNPGVPYQFGTLMRNEYATISRGADNQYGGVSRGWLQGPSFIKDGTLSHAASDSGALVVVP